MLDKSRIEAVLFDLDGTLMDTDDHKVEQIAGQLQRLRWGRPLPTARRLVMAAETPINALMTFLDILGLDSPLRSLSDRFREWRGWRTQSDFRIIPGVEEMLLAVGARYPLAIVTTRGANDAGAFLAQYRLQDLFRVQVTSECTRRLKPHPAPVQFAAHHLGIPPEKCVMVGDTTVDVKSARRAGAWAVGVLCGFGERRELERAGAQVILDSTAELSSLLCV